MSAKEVSVASIASYYFTIDKKGKRREEEDCEQVNMDVKCESTLNLYNTHQLQVKLDC